MRIVAIIQARVSSSRLPKKVLLKIADMPMVQLIVQRLSKSKKINEIIIATSNDSTDDSIVQLGNQVGVRVFRGSLNDVLDRFYTAALNSNADVIVRITGDCPLVESKVVDLVIDEFISSKVDYASNVNPPTFPDGLDVEVFSFSALQHAWKEATKQFEREHVTPYIRESGLFKTANVQNNIDLSKHRWTVDKPVDIEFVRRLFNEFTPNIYFSMNDVLKIISQKPYLLEVNQGILRNEKYASEKEADIVMKRNLEKSEEYFKRASGLIPAYTQTLSKSYTQFVQGVSPLFLEKGKGSHVWDVDGNEYIDLPLGLGPVTLGYCYEPVESAVKQQMEKGVSFSLPHRLEVEAAEALRNVIPCGESIRFTKTGSDACSAAVRIARAYTKRDKIAHCGYHGWHDWHIIDSTRNIGVPKFNKDLLLTFEYNKIETLEKLFSENKNQIAAVILEPVSLDSPEGDFLNKVKKLTQENGAILVFDEMVTGFRLRTGGAQELYGVIPDIATFGKGIANGYPLAVIAGKKEYMQVCDKIFFSSTFGGETLSLAASIAAVNEYKTNNVIEHMWTQGKKVQDAFNKKAKELDLDAICKGLPPHQVMMIKNEKDQDGLLGKSLLIQETNKRSVLASGVNNFCYSHTNEDIEKCIVAFDAALEFVQKAYLSSEPEKMLEGRKVSPIFRKL